MINSTIPVLEGRYKMLFETMLDGFAFVSMDGKILEFNESFAKLIAYTPGEILSLSYKDITPPQWHSMEEQLMDDILRFGFAATYEKEYIRKDGKTVPVELRPVLYKDEDGKNIGIFAIVRDISRRKQAEKEQKQLESALLLMLNNHSDLLLQVNPNASVRFANQSALTFMGIGKSELTSLTLPDLFHADHFDMLSKLFNPDYQPEKSLSFKLKSKSQGWSWVNWTFEWLKEEISGENLLIAIGKDFQSREHSEDEFRQRESARLRTVEKLKLAADLHDHIGHLLVSNKLRMERGLYLDNATSQKSALTEIYENHLRVIQEIRKHSESLLYSPESETDLEEAISRLVDDFARVSNITVLKNINAVFPAIPKEHNQSIIRIVQEALTNILKHSVAGLVIFQVFASQGVLIFLIRNEGENLRSPKGKKGQGLISMKERSNEIGAVLELNSDENTFFEVKLILPMDVSS